MDKASRCSDADLRQVVDALRIDDDAGTAMLDRMVAAAPGDERLLFLRGSMFANARRYPEAIESLRRALECQPEYDIARYQLGLLLLTSGSIDQASSVWKRLHDAALALFAEGLLLVSIGDPDRGLERLRSGIQSNTAYPFVNSDVVKVVDAMRVPVTIDEQPAHLLLSEYAPKDVTRH